MKYKWFSFKNIASIASVASIGLFAACEKVSDPEPPPPVPVPASRAATCALILNEGGQGANNATLSRLDLASGVLDNDFFTNDLGTHQLGDVAQDVVLYGSKAYVSVFGSGCLWAVDTATGVGKRLDLQNAGPRYIAPYGGSLYVTCYRPEATVLRIDTASFSVSGTCALGTGFHPEGIAAAGGRLWVASSWGQGVAGVQYDSMLLVLDPAALRVDTALRVGYNPQKVVALPGGRVAVNCWGLWNTTTWATEGAGLAVVDAATLRVRQVGRAATYMSATDSLLIAAERQYTTTGAEEVHFYSVDPSTLATAPMLEAASISNVYSVTHTPDHSAIYVTTDGSNSSRGDLLCLSSDGTELWRREVGWFPSKVVFY